MYFTENYTWKCRAVFRGMEVTVACDVMLWSLVDISRCFGRTCFIHLHTRRVSRTREKSYEYKKKKDYENLMSQNVDTSEFRLFKALFQLLTGGAEETNEAGQLVS
jgi:hypothetical protein